MYSEAESRPSATGYPQFDPMNSLHMVDPYSGYAALRRDAPVFYHERLALWVVSRYDDVLTVLKQPETFSSNGALLATGGFSPVVDAVLARGIGMGTVLTQADGIVHTRIRSVFNRPFAAARMAAVEPLIRSIADELIDGFGSDGSVELVREFTSVLPGLVICDLLGIPREDFPILREWDACWISLLSVDVPDDEQVRCARSLLAYERYIYEQFLDRRRSPRDDLLTAMLPGELGGAAPLSIGEAIYNVIDSVVGGYGTTARMLTNAVAVLFGHPDEYDRIRSDPASIAPLVEEILRVATPVQGIFRITTRPVELGGAQVPAAARVFLLYASANRDERHFENADKLDPGRPGIRQHLTFSDGIHFCVGSALARLTLRVALELLARRLPNLRPDAHTAPRHIRHIFLHTYETLPVQWDPPAAPQLR